MFRDRRDAADRLARELKGYRGLKDAVVLAVPRGGLPIGAVLARELGLPLDAVLTKKIPHPDEPEVAIGAVSAAGVTLDDALIRRERITDGHIAREVARLRADLERRARLYRGGAAPARVAGKTVILTDDGAATGQTLLAAVGLLREEGAARIVVALPVASTEAADALTSAADETVCLAIPEPFMAIGAFYEDFSQVSDEEAVALLKGAAASA